MLDGRINTYAALVNIQEPNFIISVHSQFYKPLKPFKLFFFVKGSASDSKSLLHEQTSLQLLAVKLCARISCHNGSSAMKIGCNLVSRVEIILVEISLRDRKSKCQIMVEEKSIRFGISPCSVDQCQVSSLKKVRYDANKLKLLIVCTSATQHMTLLEYAWFTGVKVNNFVIVHALPLHSNWAESTFVVGIVAGVL